MFFDNKQANKNIAKIEQQHHGAEVRLEKLMKEKNLVKVNGKLEAKTEYKSTIQRIMKSSDIPDYEKIAERHNPLESVVKKFEENGYTPT